MYNEERKLKYIEEDSSRNLQLEYNILRLFGRMEEKEREYNKDLCEFTVKEIIGIYKQQGTSSLETLMMTNSYYRIYTDWCLKNGYVSDGQNHYAELNYDILQKECVNIWVKDKQIFTRDELISLCSKLPNASDKFMLLGIFEGICGVQCSEIANVSRIDFDSNKRTLTTFKGRELIISDMLRDYLYQACNEYEYISFIASSSKGPMYYAKDDDRAIKRMYNASDNETGNTWRVKIGTRLRRINDEFGIDLGTKSLLCSGVIQYINDRTAKEKNLSPYDCIINDREVIENRWMNIASPKRFCLKYSNYFK